MRGFFALYFLQKVYPNALFPRNLPTLKNFWLCTWNCNQLAGLYVNRLTHINIFMPVCITSFIVKIQCPSVKSCVLTEFALKTPFLINNFMNWRYG